MLKLPKRVKTVNLNIDLRYQLLYYYMTLTEVSPIQRKLKMKFINKETKTYKVFNALYNGAKLTQSEATKRFGVKNLSAEVTRIKQNGYAVYSNTRKAANGVTVREYEMGKPSREIVALGYKAKALGITLDA
jgi:hypothetical protein